MTAHGRESRRTVKSKSKACEGRQGVDSVEKLSFASDAEIPEEILSILCATYGVD
jgi:hypothetical protein